MSATQDKHFHLASTVSFPHYQQLERVSHGSLQGKDMLLLVSRKHLLEDTKENLAMNTDCLLPLTNVNIWRNPQKTLSENACGHDLPSKSGKLKVHFKCVL